MPNNAAMKSLRLANMTASHQSTYYALSATVGRSLATVATALGVTADTAEKLLSAVVDEGLASRSVGTRDTATYLAL